MHEAVLNFAEGHLASPCARGGGQRQILSAGSVEGGTDRGGTSTSALPHAELLHHVRCLASQRYFKNTCLAYSSLTFLRFLAFSWELVSEISMPHAGAGGRRGGSWIKVLCSLFDNAPRWGLWKGTRPLPVAPHAHYSDFFTSTRPRRPNSRSNILICRDAVPHATISGERVPSECQFDTGSPRRGRRGGDKSM